jgi:hypothetical protein
MVQFCADHPLRVLRYEPNRAHRAIFRKDTNLDYTNNPSLQMFQEARHHPDQDNYGFRCTITHRYSWSFPTQRALDMIRKFSPNGVVEIGAGTGCWASFLREMGVDVVAYDRSLVERGKNRWHKWGDRKSWTKVLRGFSTAAAQHPERTLMLSWPPHGHSLSDRALTHFKGDRLVYIGQKAGGMTGTAKFHRMLARDWELVRKLRLLNFKGIEDGLYLYRRKK